MTHKRIPVPSLICKTLIGALQTLLLLIDFCLQNKELSLDASWDFTLWTVPIWHALHLSRKIVCMYCGRTRSLRVQY